MVMEMNTSSFLHARTGMVDIGQGTQAFLAVPEFPVATVEMQLAQPNEADVLVRRFNEHPESHTVRNGPYGAVILGHERYGLVQHTINLAAKFAAYGYVAIAPDMTAHWDGDKVALNRGLVQYTITDDQIVDYMSRSMDYLAGLPDVVASNIAAMGVCASGGYPLLLNAARSEVKANIVFYGGQATAPEIIEKLTAPVLGVWAEGDHVIPIDGVRRFRNVLEDKRKTFEFTVIPAMPHGFINETYPGRFRPRETDWAWGLVLDFVDRAFAGQFNPQRIVQKYTCDIAVDYTPERNLRWE